MLFIGLQIFSNSIVAQKPNPKHHLEIHLDEDEKVESFYTKEGRINTRSGYPISLYQVNYEVPSSTPEAMAIYYLSNNYESLGLRNSDLSDLQHHATRKTNAGSVVRYRQYYDDYPVNKSEVTVSIAPDNKVQMVMNSYERHVQLKNPTPSLNAEQAEAIAASYIDPQDLINPVSSRLMVYHNTKMTRLAHEVTVMAETPLGEWHVFVDAHNGEIFKVKDMFYYCGSHDEGCTHTDPPEDLCTAESKNASVVVDGSGYVFDPDPLSSNTVAYGGNYSDNSDATNVDLDAARFNVTLLDIDLTGGTYTLDGPWASIVDTEAPTEGLFSQTSSVFEFNRLEQGFEAVNCYYQVDLLMRYINVDLGCDITPYQYSGGARFDPHGLNGADNSHYSSGSGVIAFGEGGVDDSEDSDVIHHELGHGLHDWVTSGGLSQVEGLSEGSGDYIAQSYNRSLGNWDPADPAYHWVFNWDGHNPFWPGRVTNYGASYPGGLTGGIHADGQIWSTCLMGIYDDIGRQEMDKAFYEGLGMTNGSSSQNDAANAVYQAALNLGYTSQQIISIHNGFTSTGYTLPPLAGPPTAAFSESASTICLDDTNMISFVDESISSPAATAWAWIFEGGSPSTSSNQNPTVTYSAEGTYDVTLIVTNVNGSDTLVSSDHITVNEGVNCPSDSCTAVINSTVVPISSGAGAIYTSVINIPSGGTINDVNVINITGLHTYLGDLSFSLTSPANTVVVLLNRECGSLDNFDIGFDDDATTGTVACPYDDGTTYIPDQALSGFNSEDAAGDWTLTIQDHANLDGGELQSWNLEICVEDINGTCDLDLILPAAPSGIYQASNSITSTATITAPDTVVFEAGNFVELQPNFEVQLNADFTIEIVPCTAKQ